MRYFLWLLAVIGLVIIVIILLLPGGGKKSIGGKQFIDYSSTNAVASLIIDAPEGANSTHQAVRIDVSQSQVVYQELSTYNYTVVKQQTFTNNQNGYDVFLRSLYFAGFLKGNTNPALASPNGICPLGDRYIYNFVSNNQTLIHWYSTSCGDSTYQGVASLTVRLFQRQVPNYDSLTSDINF